ncbi:MAG: hypothetical protein IID46_00670 [Planctomycetes bacterium]|nr:hypothetical protein [Planctomycetota bacterium]
MANIGAVNGVISNLIDLDKKYSRDKSGIDVNFGVIQKRIDDSDMNLDKNNKTLKSNTIYYLENIARKYAYENQSDIARNQSIREALMIVLDILIANGSVTGYIIRDNIM